MERGISLERARTLIEMEKIELSVERVNLDNAYGRVLGKGLASKVEDPRFDNSAMDGWAVKKEDCPLTENKSLEIVGISQAGSSQTPTIRLGQACKIMTGAQMPEGADAIVMVEDSEIDGNKVIISGPARETYIRRKGENLSKGKEALFAGDFMSPATISLAATMGYEYIDVYRKPIIGIISTGDELVLPGSKIKDWEIYESNSFGIAALVEKMGGTPIRYDVVTDSLDKLRDSLNHAAKNCDAIITSGGVSMGDWDIVRKLMELEGDIIFWRVNIRPGGPPIFGKWNEIPIFGLPGNPVSSHVVFSMLVCPWFSASFGVSENQNPSLGRKVRVRMLNNVKGADGKICLRRIRITNDRTGLVASTHTHQGSGNINSMAIHNGLTLLPSGVNANVGDIIDAFWFN
jgi:molybdopterin molybdotransferase|tara:strand:- start:2851 stop:4062 length:1212 start_codon:yes stop_codon:yes gene_type:complete